MSERSGRGASKDSPVGTTVTTARRATCGSRCELCKKWFSLGTAFFGTPEGRHCDDCWDMYMLRWRASYRVMIAVETRMTTERTTNPPDRTTWRDTDE